MYLTLYIYVLGGVILKNLFIIAISGASYSGKTTYINKIKNIFGDKIVVFDELIRNYVDDIDVLRQEPEKYFNLQLEIIGKKIIQEAESIKKYKNKIIIFDRSLADSLYYYKNYVDVKSLSEEDRKTFQKFLNIIIRSLVKHYDNIYDKVLFLTPLNPIENSDKLRPKDIKDKQISEAFEIKSYLAVSSLETKKNKIIEANVLDEIADIDIIMKCIEDRKILSFDSFIRWYNFSKFFNDYKKETCLLANIIMNTYGSIDNYEPVTPYIIPALCTEDKYHSDIIINMCKDYVIDDEWMNSRCYPTGLYKYNNVMLVGEAPGQSGRGFGDDMLKPSFIFTNTSTILRYSIYSDKIQCPYITNLLKYAKPDNNVDLKDFKENIKIFYKELNFINPKIIVALGNNVYNYLLNDPKVNSTYRIIKYYHPAYIAYKGFKDVESYKSGLLKILEEK